LEVWRRAIIEMERLGIKARIEVVPAGIRLRTTDGTKVIERTLSAIATECDPGDPVLDNLMAVVDTIINGPVLKLIDGGQARS
jgi:hypothetical protein